MSSEIHLNLGARFTAKPAFKDWDDHVKGAQRSCKDFADVGRSVLANLAGAFEGELNGAINSTVDVLQEVVKGGIWGALGAVANVVVGAIVKKMQEAEEEAKRLKKEYDEASKRIVASAREIGSAGEEGLSRLAEEAKRAADRVVTLREEFLALKAVEAKKAFALGDKAGEQKVSKEVRAKKREVIVEDARRAVMDAEDALRLAEQNERDVEDALKKVRSRKYYHKGPYRDTREDGDPNVDIKPAEEAYRKAQDATAKAKATLENALTAHNTARARAEADSWAEMGEEWEEKQKAKKEAEDKARAEKEKKDKDALDAEKKRKEEEVRASEKAEREKVVLAAKRAREEKSFAEQAKKIARDKAKEEVKALDKVAAEKKRLSDEWESVSMAMRGKSFKEWLAEDGEASKTKSMEEKRFARSNADAARRARSIRRDARHHLAGARDLEWLAKYDRWNAAQDPANNKFAKSVEEIEAKKAQVVESMDKTLASIDAKLTQALTVE